MPIAVLNFILHVQNTIMYKYNFRTKAFFIPLYLIYSAMLYLIHINNTMMLFLIFFI